MRWVNKTIKKSLSAKKYIIQTYPLSVDNLILKCVLLVKEKLLEAIWQLLHEMTALLCGNFQVILVPVCLPRDVPHCKCLGNAKTPSCTLHWMMPMAIEIIHHVLWGQAQSDQLTAFVCFHLSAQGPSLMLNKCFNIIIPCGWWKFGYCAPSESRRCRIKYWEEHPAHTIKIGHRNCFIIKQVDTEEKGIVRLQQWQIGRYRIYK